MFSLPNDPLRPGRLQRAGAAFFGAGGVLILYAPIDSWLHLLAAGWRLPFVVEADRSGHSVLLERADA